MTVERGYSLSILVLVKSVQALIPPTEIYYHIKFLEDGS